jgi:uncharacterized membrane protein YraQ (UPF0718 family)/copper chaperone CopZ
MLELLKQFLLENVWILGQMAPYLSLGFVFAGLLYAFVPRQMVARHLGSETIGSVIRAAIIGVPLPLCSCGVVPTGIGLRRRGASRAAVVSFLISTPQTGLDSIAATYGFFGWVFAIFRPIAAFVSGIAGGIATLSLRTHSGQDEDWLRYQNQAEDALEQERNGHSFFQRFLGGMRYAFVDLLGDIALWLVIGLAVASLISMLIPDGFFTENLHSGFLQMLVMMAVGIPLYVCSTASIPIAAVLMAKGISAGAAFVFLMTGPATNAATLIIIARVMGRRVLTMYLGSIALLALCFGLGLDFLTAHTGLTVTSMVMEHDHHMLPGVITWGTALLLSFFLLSHFYTSLKHRYMRMTMAVDDNGLDLIVEGMNCTHCVRTVTESLKNVPGVNTVNVTLENGLAHVEGDNLDRDTLAKAVIGVGYKIRNS